MLRSPIRYTRAMCAPIGDGAAALIMCSSDFAQKIGAAYQVDVAATLMATGQPKQESQECSMTRLARKAYEKAGIGPEDIDVAEIHDATAFGELTYTEDLLLCPEGRRRSFCRSR